MVIVFTFSFRGLFFFPKVVGFIFLLLACEHPLSSMALWSRNNGRPFDEVAATQGVDDASHQRGSPALSQASRTSNASQNPNPQTPARILKGVRIHPSTHTPPSSPVVDPMDEIEEVEDAAAAQPSEHRVQTRERQSPTTILKQPYAAGRPREEDRRAIVEHAAAEREERSKTAQTSSPKKMRVRLNVGGTIFHTSLRTVLEGSTRGGALFDIIIAALRKQDPPADERIQRWSARIFRDHTDEQEGLKAFFIDSDPTPFPVWLEYLRTGKVPVVEAGVVRECLILASREAGLVELADGLQARPDWLRCQLVTMLWRGGGINLRGQRMQAQDLSKLGFDQCVLCFADLSGCDLSYSSFCDADLTGACLVRSNLTCADFTRAKMPDWSSGLMEGVNISGAKGWVPGDKDLSGARLRGVDLSGTDLCGVKLCNADLGDADLTSACLDGADLSGATLRAATLRESTLSGCLLRNADFRDTDLSGLNLSNCDLRNCDLSTANLKDADLSNTNLQGTLLPAWDLGLMEGVRLSGAVGWVPADKDLSNARLNGADLSGCDLTGVNLSNAAMENTKISGAILDGAVGAREETVDIASTNGLVNDLKVGSPVVYALRPGLFLHLRAISLQNAYDNYSCANRMEVLTAPEETGPWASLVLCRCDRCVPPLPNLRRDQVPPPRTVRGEAHNAQPPL